MGLAMKNVFFLALLVTGAAQAQNVIKADSVALQPLISRNAEGFQSCGVRVVASVSVGNKGESYDFSVNAQVAPLGALIKAGKYNVVLRPGHTPSFSYKVALPAPTGFWIAAVDQAVPLTALHLSPSDTTGFVIGVGDFNGATKLIYEIVKGQQVQFVARYKTEAVERIVSISKEMDGADMVSLNSCMSGLIDRLSVSAPDK